MKKIVQTSGTIGTVASIISLALATGIPAWVRILIVVVGLGCFFVLMYNVYEEAASNERICRSKKEIEEAMQELITSPGNICIMSHSLSWVTEDIIKTLKHKVEEEKTVIVFAQQRNRTTTKLENNHIEVLYYGKYNFIPQTRFTVIRYDTNNPQVAIANMSHSIRRRKKFKHVIYETTPNNSPQDEWIKSLAVDMITLCKAVCREENHKDDKKDRPKENQ